MILKLTSREKSRNTKTKEVKEVYALLVKLMESWNAYEALFKYVKGTGRYHIGEKIVYGGYSKEFLAEVSALSVLKEALDGIRSKCMSDSGFKKDFEELISKIQSEKNVSQALKEKCKTVLNNDASGIEIIALIYAQRNMYYHAAEAGKMGMEYANAAYLIKHLTVYFHKYVLKLATKIFEKEYERYKN